MKTLFFPFAPSLAHLTRCLSLAETLQGLNHECLFAVGPEGKSLVEKAGYVTRCVPEVESAVFKNSRGWGWLNENYFTANLEAELSIIDEFKPDRLVFDFRFTSALAARIKSIPSISLMHGNSVSLILDPMQTATELITAGNRAGPLSVKNRIFQYLFPKFFCHFIRTPVNRIKPLLRKYGMTDARTVFDLMRGDVNLVADIPEFIPEWIRLPENYIITGPLLWSGWDNLNYIPFKGIFTRPLIYITMGSTVEPGSTLSKLIDSLKDLPFDFIMTMGKEIAEFAAVPSNFHIYPFVPGKKIAAKSALVICHGSHETMMQVTASGTPSLLIPVNPDQVMVAWQVQRLGIGSCLNRPGSFPMNRDPLKTYSGVEIVKKVSRLVDDMECRQKCLEIKKSVTGFIENKEYLKFF